MEPLNVLIGVSDCPCGNIYHNVDWFHLHNLAVYSIHSKGKAIPLQVWASPEVSRRVRLPDFKTIGT
jgi:hypothetical protein